MAAILPLSGLLIAIFFAKETKRNIRSLFGSKSKESEAALKTPIKVPAKASESSSSSSSKAVGSESGSGSSMSGVSSSAPLSLEVLSLVINGFLLMYGEL
jgi:hypothetical protein